VAHTCCRRAADLASQLGQNSGYGKSAQSEKRATNARSADGLAPRAPHRGGSGGPEARGRLPQCSCGRGRRSGISCGAQNRCGSKRRGIGRQGRRRRVSPGPWQTQGSVMTRISNCVTDRFCRRARSGRGYGGGRKRGWGCQLSSGSISSGPLRSVLLTGSRHLENPLTCKLPACLPQS
jgi:hypothetical protein